MQRRITDDLHALLAVLPPNISAALTARGRADDLLEIIMDLGRLPAARFIDGEVALLDNEITHAEIDYVITRIGAFDADNRAGMERTLHRISGIRNRRGQVVGLTCRVGRAVYGTVDIIQDIIEAGKSVLLLGRPGVGKTTILREAARILAGTNRVVIVDTSNEIGGDGDVPHPAVGRARRMQVAQPNLQHEVMIEAVENHNPQVIVIDEIGRELEAQAARTIAERGVQLIGTAHGNTLENILLNPTLADLVGGIESVTLSDEEARRRGTQKTVLERRAPPTFEVLLEIQDRENLIVHHNVAEAVDAFLRGKPMPPERRYRDEHDELHKEIAPAPAPRMKNGRLRGEMSSPAWDASQRNPFHNGESRPNYPSPRPAPMSAPGASAAPSPAPGAAPQTMRIYAYGVARNRLEQSAKRLRVPIVVTETLEDAQVLVTLKTYYRSHKRIITDAEDRRLSIYVLRANTVSQLEDFLSDLFNLSAPPTEETFEANVISETQRAINAVLNGEPSVDLPPASASVRRVQHDLARKANLISHSYGKEPRRRVRIFKD
jgi:stage III sporulation protein SpoIIIAA